MVDIQPNAESTIPNLNEPALSVDLTEFIIYVTDRKFLG